MDGDRPLVLAAELRCDARSLPQIERWLSAEERVRADRFRAPELRHRFLVSRGVLREVLGRWVGDDPGALVFEAGEHGKPRLRSHPHLHFNLAHSSDLLLLAISTAGEVGVDVERVRPLRDALAVARRFFTGREAAWLEQQDLPQRDTGFFHLWTRKEAVLKGSGMGIAHGLNALEFIEDGGAFCRRLTFPESSAAPWHIAELQPADGYVAALALSQPTDNLSCHAWVTAR
jgi:4'-phosphopantetheinyl transferase